MPKSWTLFVSSRSGEKVNTLTGESHDSVAVYSEADLKRRLVVAETDPRDLNVIVREES